MWLQHDTLIQKPSGMDIQFCELDGVIIILQRRMSGRVKLGVAGRQGGMQ